MSGLIYGLIIHNPNDEPINNTKFILKLILSSTLSLGLISIGLTSLWVKITSGKAFAAVLAARVLPQIIMLPIQVVTIFLLYKALQPLIKKYL